MTLLWPILSAWCVEGVISQANVEVDVIVLGAGIAGVNAAATLYHAGVTRFLVLEQSDRVGGRMINIDWHGRGIEVGANWIEGIPQNENPIWKIAQEIGLKGNYTNQEGDRIQPTLFDSNGRVPKAVADELHARLKEALLGALNVCCHRQMNNLGDVSLREGLLLAGWPTRETQTPLQRTLEFFVVDWDFEFPAEQISIFNYFSVGHSGSWKEVCNVSNNVPPRQVLPRAKTARSMGLLGGFRWESPRYFVTDPRGFAAVADHVASSFLESNNSRIIFNENVTNISYTPNRIGVEVHTASGISYSAKYAISTFSAGVVNYAVEAKTMFHPELPDWKARAYAKVPNGIYTKIYALYKYSFWDNADYVLFAHPNKRGYYAVWQDLESDGKLFPKDANILMVTLVQDDSRRVEAQDKRSTIAELQAALKMMYGQSIPDPIDILVPVWGSNTSFRGCWSNAAVGATKEDFESQQRPVGGLHFAGESTDYEFNGFVAGGYNSGRRAAFEVIEGLHENVEPPLIIYQ